MASFLNHKSSSGDFSSFIFLRFTFRFLRSEIEHAIELGFVMSRISTTIHAVTYSLQAMPILIHALIMRKRIMEAVTVLFELEYFAEEDIDNSG